jgi:hypothetical protein
MWISQVTLIPLEAAFELQYTVMSCFAFLFGKKVSSDVRRDPEIIEGNLSTFHKFLGMRFHSFIEILLMI